MKWTYILCAVSIGFMLAASPVSAAKKKKEKKQPVEDTSTVVVPSLAAPTNDGPMSLPEGVHSIAGYGLCRERPERAVVVAPRPRPRPKGNIEGTVTLSGPAANVVVYIEGAPGSRPQPLQHQQILQRDLAFVPEVNVVTVGTTIDFPNQDHVFHNIFSVSGPAKFDLGLYKAGDSRSFTFTKPGTVDVYCNIHPQMVSKIKVLDTKFYAITGRDGKFQIENIPEGKYKLFAWQPDTDETQDEVEIHGNDTVHHDVTIRAGHALSSAHLRKDGTPYGRYK